MPFLVNKESGPLYPDLLVQLNTSDLTHDAQAHDTQAHNTQMNTSDLLNDTMFDSVQRPSESHSEPVKKPIGTADLIESLVSNIDSSFDDIQQSDEVQHPELEAEPIEQQVEMEMTAESFATEEVAQAEEMHSTWDVSEGSEANEAAESVTPLDPPVSSNADIFHGLNAETDLQDIFEELREDTATLQPMKDFETHYSLGLAYKDMDLLDDAIGEFQRAFRMAGLEDLKGDYIQCCNMLGVCFKRKQMTKVAIQWFERGLKIPNRPEDEYQALRYDIALCYEELGEPDKALDVYMEVYGIDVSYREVASKIKELQASKNA